MKRHRTSIIKQGPSSVTVNDVANLAGVSTATVSRSLNTPNIVSSEVRERVEAAVNKLGYIPNDSARALRQNQTRLIGIIVPTLSYALYAEFFKSAQKRLEEENFYALLTTSEYDPKIEAEQIFKLTKQGAQGLILVGRQRDPKAKIFLSTSKIPYICTYSIDHFDNDVVVGFDNMRAIADVIDYLVILGHQRIAMLSGITSKNNDRALARVLGFKAAVEAHKLSSGNWVAEAPYTIEGGRLALSEILKRGHNPTAVVCGSDMLGIGALQECRSRGIRVPADLSVMGFDDLEVSAHLATPLSTVSVPSKEIGRLAADFMIDISLGREINKNSILKTKLVIRSSTAPPTSV